jgi:segregation and condensation protein A
MDILEYAESGTYWRRIIYDIVNSESFDPWDIDVGSLTDSYLQKVKEIKMINFEVPGTIILVGSVLLKLKSDIVSGKTFIFEENLSLDGDEDMVENELVADFDDAVGSDPLPPAMEHGLLVRRIPKRKVTLPELMALLKRVVTQVEKKDIIQKDLSETRLELHLTKKNMDRIMREVYRDIRRLSKDVGGGPTSFKQLVDDWRRENVVAYFLPVLHLANKDKIIMDQKEIYGDILISPK